MGYSSSGSHLISPQQESEATLDTGSQKLYYYVPNKVASGAVILEYFILFEH